MLKGDAFLGWTMVEKGTLAQGDINIEIHGPKKPDVAKGSGDFTDCMSRIVPAMAKEGKSPDDPNAFCAWYEHNQSGHWPGEKSVGKRDSFLGGFGYEPSFDEILKAWSDAARAAALEARRQGSSGQRYPGDPEPSAGFHSGAPGNVSTQGGAESHMVAHEHGWEAAGSTNAGAQQLGGQRYTHPGLGEGHQLVIMPSGEWGHTAPGGYRVQGDNKNSMANYLNHLHGRTAQAA